jgi:Fic family protein
VGKNRKILPTSHFCCGFGLGIPDILPPEMPLETVGVLRALAKASRALAELKGYAETMPNQHILINAVTINEAKDSSAIENIITTHDELYEAMSGSEDQNPSAKEVVHYRSALWEGYCRIQEQGILTTNLLIDIQSIIVQNQAGIRKLPGTVLLNSATGETVYTPPSGEDELRRLLANLEQYIHDNTDGVDPLIKLAVIHYQFESIHPFYDGNGRTGRILNVLYLVMEKLLDSPILYLSSYIIRNKDIYYRLLQRLRQKDNWEEWILFILSGIEQTATETLGLIKRIHEVIVDMTAEIKESLPKIYSKELIDLLFYEFYTKIPYIQAGLGITRKTAASYLQMLEKAGYLVSRKIGRERIYQNKRLFDLVRML